MSANDKKSEVFSYFKEVKCEFIVRSHTISMNIGLLNTSSHLCQCKSVCVWKNKRVFFCDLRSLHGFPGQAISWNHQGCNRHSMQRMQTLGHLGLVCV